MPRARAPILAAAALVWTLPSPGAADTITLVNGRVIEADRAWWEGSQLRYEKDGGLYGLPRSLVKHVDQTAAPEPASDPDILSGRERLASHEPVEAARLFKLALRRDPQSVPALQGLVEAELALGEVQSARETAERAVRVDDRNARSRALLGDVYAILGDRARAEEQYRRSLLLRPDPEVRRKLGEVAATAMPSSPSREGPLFRVKYEGGANETLGMAVVRALTETHLEYGRRLGFSPEEPVTVVLQATASFSGTGGPGWANGLNDGTIRVPALGVEQLTPELLRVLRHELAHSFVASRTANNCPTWLHEGIAQWLEGGDPNRGDGGLARLARAGEVPNLLTLESPFRGLSEEEAGRAYALSLSAVAHILRKRGESGIVRLISALSDRLPSEEALPVALALSYPEFQKSWEEHLKTADRAAANAPPP
jgi:tetratricopeptide (TPR) repeat protein